MPDLGPLAHLNRYIATYIRQSGCRNDRGSVNGHVAVRMSLLEEGAGYKYSRIDRNTRFAGRNRPPRRYAPLGPGRVAVGMPLLEEEVVHNHSRLDRGSDAWQAWFLSICNHPPQGTVSECRGRP